MSTDGGRAIGGPDRLRLATLLTREELAEPAVRQDLRLAEGRREMSERLAEAAGRKDWRLAEARRDPGTREGLAEPAARQDLRLLSASLQSGRRVLADLSLQSAQRRLV